LSFFGKQGVLARNLQLTHLPGAALVHSGKMNAASSYDLGVVEALKVTYPDFLQNHITAIQWSHLHLAEPHESTGDQSLIEFVK
jgi:hypothetical protein